MVYIPLHVAWKSPIVWKDARGSRLTDVDGREYIDYHEAFGSIILGHRYPFVDQCVIDSIQSVDLLGVGTTEQEIQLSRKVVQHVPSAEKVLLCVTVLWNLMQRLSKLPAGLVYDEKQSKTSLGPDETEGFLTFRAQQDAPILDDYMMAVMGQITYNRIYMTRVAAPFRLTIR